MSVLNPPAIVWSQASPTISCEQVNETGISVDVSLIQSWIAIAKELLQIKSLGSNWDCFGADPVSTDVWDAAYRFLKMSQEQDATFPPKRVALAPDGAIGFEWVKGNTYIRAEIPDSTTVNWMITARAKRPEFMTQKLFEESAASREQTWQLAPDVEGALALPFAH